MFSASAGPTPDRPAGKSQHSNSMRSQERTGKMTRAQAQEPRTQTLSRAQPEMKARVRPEAHAQTQTEQGCLTGGGNGDPAAPVWGAGFPQEKTRGVCNGETCVEENVAGSRTAGSEVFGRSGAVAEPRVASTGHIGANKNGGEEQSGCRRAVTGLWARRNEKGRKEAYSCEVSEPEERPTDSVGTDTGAHKARECSEPSGVFATRRSQGAEVCSVTGSPDTQKSVGLGDTSNNREMAVFNNEERYRNQSLRSTSEGTDVCGIVEAYLNVGASTPAQDLRCAAPVDVQTYRRNEVEECFTASICKAADTVVNRSSSPPLLEGHDSALLPTASSSVFRANLLTENNAEAQHKTLEANPREGCAYDNKRDEERATTTTRVEQAVDVAHKEVEVSLHGRPRVALPVVAPDNIQPLVIDDSVYCSRLPAGVYVPGHNCQRALGVSTDLND